MGYCTRFSLEIIQGDDFHTDYKGEISILAGYQDCFDDEIKWYDHEDNMREYSEKHPNVLFKLSGEGYDPEDLWVEYYKNGKMQRSKARIIYDEFDENRLQ